MTLVSYKQALQQECRSGAQSKFSGPTNKPRDVRNSVTIDVTLGGTPLSHRLTCAGKFNHFCIEQGETLPEGYGRNYQGLVIKHMRSTEGINLAAVHAEAGYFQDHTIIASFMGKKIPHNSLSDWVLSIN
jgi:hypothetical protein